jgi:hypothetical protein
MLVCETMEACISVCTCAATHGVEEEQAACDPAVEEKRGCRTDRRWLTRGGTRR